jgi:hypothetical protein
MIDAGGIAKDLEGSDYDLTDNSGICLEGLKIAREGCVMAQAVTRRFSQITSDSPANFRSTDCSIFII